MIRKSVVCGLKSRPFGRDKYDNQRSHARTNAIWV